MVHVCSIEQLHKFYNRETKYNSLIMYFDNKQVISILFYKNLHMIIALDSCPIEHIC